MGTTCCSGSSLSFIDPLSVGVWRRSRVISGPELLALAWDELRSEGFEDAATIQDIQQRKDQMLDLTESQTGEITPEQLARLLGLDTGLAVW